MTSSCLRAVTAFRLSALAGFAGVGLGAFGAHQWRAVLGERHSTETWKTAVLYHLAHAVILLILATRPQFRPGAWAAFAVGIVLFSGSLYALALGAPRWTGAITPVGGLCFLGGYLALAWQAKDWAANAPPA